MADPRHRRRRTASTRITPENWAAVRSAAKDIGDRFAALVLSAPDPGAMATADWTVMDTAAHVTAFAWTYTALVVGDDEPLPVPGGSEHLLTTTVHNMHRTLNPAFFDGYPERRPRAVVDRLGSSIEQILDRTATADPTRNTTWLGGSQLPVAGLVAHIVNELMLHGHDIARATGAPWTVPDEYAALFIDLFMVEIARNGVGSVLDDGKPPRPGRIAVEFRSALTRPTTIVLQDGEVWAEEPSRDNDVRLAFQPAMLDLVLFHRVSRPRAALTGALRVWGRRPWLLRPFLQVVQMP
jgi:Mycothiol maleylpyruvate isomerase N-terminal domain